eukprot:8728863-Pyramimonas_sp.AAC.1
MPGGGDAGGHKQDSVGNHRAGGARATRAPGVPCSRHWYRLPQAVCVRQVGARACRQARRLK